MEVFPNTASASLINNKSYVQTPFSLLTQNKPLPHDLVCTNSTSCGKGLPQTICECTHIIQVPLNAIAELIFIDYTQGNTLLPHPLHLHGTDMYILKQGKIPLNVDKGLFLSQLIRQLDQEGPRLRTTQPRPVVKDTVGNLPSGYTVVRVHFNNPEKCLRSGGKEGLPESEFSRALIEIIPFYHCCEDSGSYHCTGCREN
ncbi:uncharacterized protein LOC103524966 [Diaphorina citri]|uniref:Uncharacterized protein LOC103524966 n=1 Tax=Diaphorina citri TaxID=121845 RepID=A0A1S3DVE9_DIACI|nr:uncharacterized protein LOC103524966 [Diaphorina citri]